MPTPSDKTLYSLMLPSMMYAVQGNECNVYFDGILNGTLDPSDCTFDVTFTTPIADASRHENGRWTLVPAAGNVADNTLAVSVIYGSQQLQKSTILRVRGPTASPSQTRKLLAIGDSTTHDGQYLAELINLSTGSGLTITTVGTQTATTNDSASNSRTVHYEVGKAGVNFCYTDPTSPFVFSGVFNFATYLSNNSIALASGDWVVFVMGINDVFSYTDDASVLAHITTLNTQLSAMITNIKAAVSGIRVAIGLIIPPAAYQDAFGYSYNTGQTRKRYKRNRDLWVQNLITTYDNQTGSSIYLLPMHACLDTVNNMNTTTVAVNSRNTTTIARQNNGVHPANAGYWQMADALYTFLRGQET